MESPTTSQSYRERKRQIADMRKQYQHSKIKNGDKILHMVIKNEEFSTNEKIEILGILIDEGDDPNVENDNGETILHLAINRREKDVIDFLLLRNITFKDSVAVYLLRQEKKKIAEIMCEISDEELQKIENESANFVEWLISKGLDIDRRNEDNENALVVAINIGLSHILPVLLSHAKNIDFVDDSNNTLLHLFMYRAKFKRYQMDIVKILLDRGVSVDAEDNCKQTPIEIAIEEKINFDVIKMMIERSSNIDHKNIYNETLFNVVIREWIKDTEGDYHMKIASVLIAKGADINEPDDDGMSPLCHAVQDLNPRAVEFLQDNKADFSVTKRDGETLMHLLVSSDSSSGEYLERTKIKLFDMLINSGCQVNVKDKNGMTPLHIAASSYSIAIVRKLLENGGEVNCRNNRKETPLLRLATHSCSMEMAELLLQHGANVNARDNQGFTVLHAIIFIRGTLHRDTNCEMLQMFLKYGADFDARTNAGHSVLRKGFYRRYNASKLFLNIPEYLPSPCLNDSRCIDKIMDILMKHYIKLDVVKLLTYTADEYKKFIGETEKCENYYETEKYKNYYEKCLTEVARLKSTFINNFTSLYDFLHTNANSRYAHVNNDQLQQLLRSTKGEEEFPEFSVILRSSYHETVTRRRLLEPARKAWLELTQIDNLPDECIDHIFSFLSNEDLFAMIEKE